MQAGRLPLPEPAGQYLRVKKLAKDRDRSLARYIGSRTNRTESLPLHHRDPFDRLLIAQSIEEGWPIVTADPWFARYPVDVIW